jgi:hypothetical protein
MKTPMQELIEYIELNQPKNKITDGIWSKAKSLLEKEKELLIDFHCEGQNIEESCGVSDAQDYYNEKFNNNE